MKYNEHTGIPFIILTIVIFVGMIIAFTHIVMWIIGEVTWLAKAYNAMAAQWG